MTTAAPPPTATGVVSIEPSTLIVCTGFSGSPSLPLEIENTRIAALPGVPLTGSRRKSPTIAGGAAIFPASCPTCKTCRHWPVDVQHDEVRRIGRKENQAMGGVDDRRQPNCLRQLKISRRVARRRVDQQQTLVFRQQQQPLARLHRLGNDRLSDGQSPEELARRALDAEQFLVHGIAEHDIARAAGPRDGQRCNARAEFGIQGHEAPPQGLARGRIEPVGRSLFDDKDRFPRPSASSPLTG